MSLEETIDACDELRQTRRRRSVRWIISVDSPTNGNHFVSNHLQMEEGDQIHININNPKQFIFRNHRSTKDEREPKRKHDRYISDYCEAKVIVYRDDEANAGTEYHDVKNCRVSYERCLIVIFPRDKY